MSDGKIEQMKEIFFLNVTDKRSITHLSKMKMCLFTELLQALPTVLRCFEITKAITAAAV
jgi:hypothetical protein